MGSSTIGTLSLYAAFNTRTGEWIGQTVVVEAPSSVRRLRGPVTDASKYYVVETASRASRPVGGAFGAPGHRPHHVVGCDYVSKLTLAGSTKPPLKIEA